MKNRKYFNRRRILIIVAISILSVLFVGGILLTKKLIAYEQRQSIEIRILKTKIDELEKAYADKDNKIIFDENEFNCLFIGNSITVHPINEYWWNEIGMAASKKDNDYVHLVS